MIPIFQRRLGVFGKQLVGIPEMRIIHAKNGTFSATFRGTTGAVIYCDPGDGSAVQQKTLLGTGTDVVFSYANGGTQRIVKVFGDLRCISTVFVSNVSVSSVNITPLTALEYLYLHFGSISDLSKIPVNRLVYCYAYNNPIVDISALSMLPSSMTYLFLQYCYITDISPIVGTVITTRMRLTANPITYAGYTWVTQTSGEYFFDSTVTTADEVDQWLIDLATAGWSGCTIHLNGTNPARTSASDLAVVQLLMDGNILYLN